MRLPAVEAGFVLTVDGKAATRARRGGRPDAPGGNRRLAEIRGNADAVLVGRRTLEADDPDARVASAKAREERVRRGLRPEPLRVVFSSSGKLRRTLKIFRPGGEIVVFTTKAMPAKTRAWLSAIADVRVEPRVKSVNLRRALAILAGDYGVRRAFCEGGPSLVRGLVQDGLLARLHIAFVPLVFGGAEAPTLLGPAGISGLKHSVRLRLEAFAAREGGAFATYRVAQRKG